MGSFKAFKDEVTHILELCVVLSPFMGCLDMKTIQSIVYPY